jgi:hypothetical protein
MRAQSDSDPKHPGGLGAARLLGTNSCSLCMLSCADMPSCFMGISCMCVGNSFMLLLLQTTGGG